MHDIGDTRAIGSTGNRFDDEMRELAYEIWAFRAGRNATRTLRILEEECREAADEQINRETGEMPLIDEESLNIPTVRQVQRWAKDGHWAERATDGVAKLAPRTHKSFNARLFEAGDLALDFVYDMLAGEYDQFRSPGILATKEKTAAGVLTLLGVGTAAGLMPVAMPQAVPEAMTGEETPQELARKQRERLRELRGGN
jgi:hypothetical protein